MIDRCKFVHNLPCEQVSMRITELEEENDKLRKENEELRDLAKRAMRCINGPLTCYDCLTAFGGCHVRGGMRELGIGESND